jgi:hypothetical protein
MKDSIKEEEDPDYKLKLKINNFIKKEEERAKKLLENFTKKINNKDNKDNFIPKIIPTDNEIKEFIKKGEEKSKKILEDLKKKMDIGTKTG